MNPIIENPLQTSTIEDLTSLLFEYNAIVHAICVSRKEKHLRRSMEEKSFNNFKYGFGGSHMWVKQVINGKTEHQVLFVNF